MLSKQTWRWAAALGLIGAAVTLSCGDKPAPSAPSVVPSASPQHTPPPVPPPPPPPPSAILVGAGDIAMCGAPEVEATARLLDEIPGTVFTAGDNAYPNGSSRDFAACYEPTWGRHKHRTRPVPGNHEYQTPGAAGYYQYFGAAAGPAGLGYYTYREGAWLIVAINSALPAGPDSPQAQWLRATLNENATPCIAAIWHHPLYTSGPNGENHFMREVWRILQEAGADIVISGHDHLYERFAPQDADGRLDPLRGIRQFTAGTGGAHIYHVKSLKRNSEIVGQVSGVLKLTLKATSYDWQFVPISGTQFSDAGSGDCR